jgi:hypothetical protein
VTPSEKLKRFHAGTSLFQPKYSSMKSFAGGILILGLALSLVAHAQLGTDQSPAPAEQYKALFKAYQTASSSGRVLSDEERMKFVGQVYRLRNVLALKFVELAEKYPNDPIAVDSLLQALWQVNGTPWPVELVGRDEASSRALALLARDHLQSDKLGPTCQRISSGFRKEYEPFLRAVFDKNPHKDVQAQAGFALAHFLTNRLQRIDLMNEQPDLAKEFSELFGQEYLAELKRQDRTKVNIEAEALLEQVASRYGEVKLPESEGSTVGEKAAAELFELRRLVAGKEAPEIEGNDQDGKRFRLSDYRGKVVLLDFWSEY